MINRHHASVVSTRKLRNNHALPCLYSAINMLPDLTVSNFKKQINILQIETMKFSVTIFCLFGVLSVLYFAAMATANTSTDKGEVLSLKRFLFGYNCDNLCTHGGCFGQRGACYGICYCYGSGYEHRCTYCDY